MGWFDSPVVRDVFTLARHNILWILIALAVSCLLVLGVVVFVKKKLHRRFNWDVAKQFITLAHEFWYPVSKRSPLVFMALLLLLVFFVASLYFYSIFGVAKFAHWISPEYAARLAPGLLPWIRSLFHSSINVIFLAGVLVPATAFLVNYRKLRGRFAPWAYLFSLLVLSFSVSGLNVVISYVYRFMMTAINLKDAPGFWQNIGLIGVIFVIGMPVVAYYYFIQKKLAMRWRKALTMRVMDDYLANRAYYRISTSAEIDNPDQRIASDINSFTINSLDFLLSILDSSIQFFAFVGILFAISKQLSLVLLVYCTVGTFLVILFGKKLTTLNFNQLRKEADFRYSLVHVRNNAESIAFYQGERREIGSLRSVFGRALDNFNVLIGWQRNLRLFTKGYDYAVVILPFIVVVPLFFAGKIDFGVISQANMAFNQVMGAISIIVMQFDGITAFVAGIRRISVFNDRIRHSDTAVHPHLDRLISNSSGPAVTLRNVALDTPDGARTLLSDLNFSLAADDRLLIAGPSGVGKTSLLRAIAGLWDRGQGSITRPPLEHTLFLPQKPYMILGNLREQILYPRSEGLGDAELSALLEKVQLGPMARKLEAASAGANIFDRMEKWDDFLSQGEQQRLAFARIFATRPSFVILDEATSALDTENEKILYGLLSEQKIPYISIGHRPMLARFHSRVLLLSENGWEIIGPDEYLNRMEQVYRS